MYIAKRCHLACFTPIPSVLVDILMKNYASMSQQRQLPSYGQKNVVIIKN